MAIQTLELDPAATSYTDDEIVNKINLATNQITRASSVASSARPIESAEVTNTELAVGTAKANLDAMADLDRAYIKTDPDTGQGKVISLAAKLSNGKVIVTYDDVPAV